jgi:hypothetical protein
MRDLSRLGEGRQLGQVGAGADDMPMTFRSVEMMTFRSEEMMSSGGTRTVPP